MSRLFFRHTQCMWSAVFCSTPWASTRALPLRGALRACKQLEVCFDDGKVTLTRLLVILATKKCQISVTESEVFALAMLYHPDR